MDALGNASAIDQLLWVAEVEASMSEDNHSTTSNKDSSNTREATKNNNAVPAAKTTSRPEQQNSKGFKPSLEDNIY